MHVQVIEEDWGVYLSCSHLLFVVCWCCTHLWMEVLCTQCIPYRSHSRARVTRASYNIDIGGGNTLVSYLYKYPVQLSGEGGNDITQGLENGDGPAGMPVRGSSLFEMHCQKWQVPSRKCCLLFICFIYLLFPNCCFWDYCLDLICSPFPKALRLSSESIREDP